jgi:hypothetical protein
MAEPDKSPVTLEELLVMIEKGLITGEQFMQKISEERATYQKLITNLSGRVILWPSSTVPNARKKFQTRRHPVLERAIAEEVEARIGVPILIYVCLDDTPLPKHDDKRIAIKAKKQPLKVVGGKILHALRAVVCLLNATSMMRINRFRPNDRLK